MSKTSPRRRTTREQLDRSLKASNTLTIVLKGHLAIEALLDLGISEILSAPHRLEVQRLGFALKVDLAVALGLLQEDVRPPYVKINNLRNGFAHGSRSRFDRRDARELYNAWPPFIQKAGRTRFEDFKTPLDVLRDSIAVAFVILESRITSIRDDKVRSIEWMKMVDEALGPREERRKRRSLGAGDDERTKRVEEKVAIERERRAAAGDL